MICSYKMKEFRKGQIILCKDLKEGEKFYWPDRYDQLTENRGADLYRRGDHIYGILLLNGAHFSVSEDWFSRYDNIRVILL